MAIRRYCDHCGNTIKTPNVFSYGPFKMIEDYNNQQMQAIHYGVAQQQMHAHANSQGLGGAAGMAVKSLPKPKILENYTTIDVDLCDHCVPLWMERVRQITAQSDPEEKK